MARVRNKNTGRTYDVPAGHYSLTSGDYEIVTEEPAPPAPNAPKAPATGNQEAEPQDKPTGNEEVANDDNGAGPDKPAESAGVPDEPTPKRGSNRAGGTAGRKRRK